MEDDARESERLERALDALGARRARLAFVLGSGLGVFVERMRGPRAVAYDEIDGMPRSRVSGHAGRFVLGTVAGVEVAALQGRVHLYEGHSVATVTRAVRALTALGCRGIVLTNAAGGIRRGFEPGTLMRIRDHVNLQAVTPRASAGRGTPYDERFGLALERGAERARVQLERGVYAALPGPAYETPAEIRMLARGGADAVGMSTACEALAAHAGGARVTAISCITNLAAGISAHPLSHAEVLAVGRQVSERFCSLLESATPDLAAAVAS